MDRRGTLAAIAVAFAAFASLASSGPAAIAAAAAASLPATPAERARARASDDCAGCHADIAAEWRSSLHRASHDDPSYLVSLPGEPLAFCNGCHAPVATRASVGVDCVSCHGAPHDTTAPAKDATSSCASCHEFDFPAHARSLPHATEHADDRTIDPTEQMQRTVSEHAASVEKDRSCPSCHMPKSGAHVSHRFAASRDAALLRGAVAASARGTSDGTVTLDLRAIDPGHAFPTGDMFRRLVVHADAVDASGAIVGSAERALAREFRLDGPGRTPHESADGRLPASGAPIAVSLDLGERALGAAVRWRVDYERITNGFRHPLEVRARITLASGTVPAGP